MPERVDWTAFVRDRLRLPGLRETRQAEIVEDVARQLEDAFRDALAEGLSESDARARAEQHVSDWAALARDLSSSSRDRTLAFDRWSANVDDRTVARGRFTVVDRLFADIRYAVRLMVKTPGFSGMAVLMLAIGTGLNAAVFSVVDGVMLQSPFHRPEEIASVLVAGPNGQRSAAISRETWDRIVGLPHFVSAAAEFTNSSPILTGVDVPRRAQVECIPASMIDVLGSPPLLGRWFSAVEDTPAGPAIGVVSYAFWQGTLNGDPGVLGRRVLLDDQPVEIVGVMPRGFEGVLSRPNRDLWAPLGQVTESRAAYGCRRRADTSGLIRLRPGMSFDATASSINAALGPVTLRDGPGTVSLIALSEQTHGRGLDKFMIAATGGVIAVLLIACVNVANLGLARLTGRRREIAVRLALGATRGRIVRQTITEQLVVAGLGAAVGIAFALLAFDAVVALLPRTLPQKAIIALNGRVLVASIAVTILAALIVGLVPALQTSRVGLLGGLTAGDRGSTAGGRRFRWALVVVELALGVMLLVGALLMIRTFLILRPSAPGFDPTNKVVALVRLPSSVPADDRHRFFSAVADDLLSAPGVHSVAGTTYLPMSRTVDTVAVAFADVKATAIASTVSVNYLDVMRIPVVRGRGFLETDGPGSEPVAIVNEAFVRRWLGGGEPLGTLVGVGARPAATTPRRIVGVVGDTRFIWSDTNVRPEIYMPWAQEVLGPPYVIVSGTPAGLAVAPRVLRESVSRHRPGQLVDRVDRFEALLAAELAYPRLGAWLFGLFGALAVALGAIGLASTLAWSVAERRREIGVRMALGATPASIRALVVRQTLAVAALAIVGGLAAAVFASKLIAAWIYGVARTDVTTYVVCGGAMLVIALMAAYVPARRATRVDPLVTLRAE